MRQEKVRGIFSLATRQDDVLDGLYRLIFTEWDS